MRLTIQDAIEVAKQHGLVAYAQRGFYSHFLRVRTQDYATLNTIPIVRRSVSRRSLYRAILNGPL